MQRKQEELKIDVLFLLSFPIDFPFGDTFDGIRLEAFAIKNCSPHSKNCSPHFENGRSHFENGGSKFQSGGSKFENGSLKFKNGLTHF
jgi:hypothetical protein